MPKGTPKNGINKGRFKKGHKGFTSWLGKKFTKQHRIRLGLAKIGRQSNAWTGDKVGYHGLHSWVKSKLGKPNLCEHCRTTAKRRYEWANKSGKYRRELADWIRLCVPCHRKMDGNLPNVNIRWKKIINKWQPKQ